MTDGTTNILEILVFLPTCRKKILNVDKNIVYIKQTQFKREPFDQHINVPGFVS